MTKTNYELTIGGKLRKVYKNSNGFFVKMNSKNLDVNEYFLKNGGGLKSKYKKKIYGGNCYENDCYENDNTFYIQLIVLPIVIKNLQLKNLEYSKNRLLSYFDHLYEFWKRIDNLDVSVINNVPLSNFKLRNNKPENKKFVKSLSRTSESTSELTSKYRSKSMDKEEEENNNKKLEDLITFLNENVSTNKTTYLNIIIPNTAIDIDIIKIISIYYVLMIIELKHLQNNNLISDKIINNIYNEIESELEIFNQSAKLSPST
jgi:hypothetical protein